MKIKVAELKQVIREEVIRAETIKGLEAKKKNLQETIGRLQESYTEEELEELWGGLKNVGKKIGNYVSDKVSDQGIMKGVDKAKKWASDKAGQAVQTYKQGESQAAYDKDKHKITKIAQQIRFLQKKYKALTGQPYKGGAHNPKRSAMPVQ